MRDSENGAPLGYPVPRQGRNFSRSWKDEGAKSKLWEKSQPVERFDVFFDCKPKGWFRGSVEQITLTGLYLRPVLQEFEPISLISQPRSNNNHTVFCTICNPLCVCRTISQDGSRPGDCSRDRSLSFCTQCTKAFFAQYFSHAQRFNPHPYLQCCRILRSSHQVTASLW